jgi:tetratricopeptide (TPR) repeat protein
LLSRPDGPRIRHANQAAAEGLYAKVQAMDSSYANVYRGLGLLYQDQGKWNEAQAAYRRYLELAPEASDSLRIRRRVDTLDKTLN